MAPAVADSVSITVLVDNDSLLDELRIAYGISFYMEIHAGRKTYRVLFDTGPSITVLRHNAYMLGIDLGRLDKIVISHFHKDHYGALGELAGGINRPLVIYVPEEPWFAQSLFKALRKMGHRFVHTSMFTQVVPGLYALGPVTNTREISLEILLGEGKGGLLIGCGHGGLQTITRWARYLGEYMLLAGGFHLKEEPQDKVVRIAEWIRDKLKPRMVVPLHCSDHKDVFSEVLKESYVEGGAGLEVIITAENISSRPKPLEALVRQLL